MSSFYPQWRRTTNATRTALHFARNPTMNEREPILQDNSVVKVAIMGETGAGKSKFIHLLTNDDKIQIGHDLKSKTSDVQTACYTDAETGCSVMLIDTPGFDNSQDGITATDILQKIIAFLTPQSGKSQRLNGIIYMHHINDPRKGSHAPKNLAMFRKLCGDENLRHVRLVTTHWDDASEEICAQKEGDLKKGAFRILLAAGAQIHRHTNTIESAQAIISELIPLPKISTQLQNQVAEGAPIGETDAGRIINDDIEELKKKHTEELANLRKRTEEAAQGREEALTTELEAKRKALEEKLARAEEDQERLKMTVEELRKQQAMEREVVESLGVAFAEETAKLRKDHERAQEEVRRLRMQVELAEKQHREDILEERNRRHEGDVATARRQEERQEGSEVMRLAKAERNVAELQKRIEELEAAKRNLEDYVNHGGRFPRDMVAGAPDAVERMRQLITFIGTMAGICVVYVLGRFVASGRF